MIKKITNTLSARYLNGIIRLDITYLIQGGFWSLLSDGAQQLSAIAAALLITRLAGQEILGQYQLILSLLATISVVSITGIDTTIMRDVSRGKEGVYQQALLTRFRWSWLASPIFLLVSLYFWFNNQSDIATALFFVAILSPWHYLLLSWRNFFKAKKLFAIHSKFSIAKSLLALVGVAASVYFLPSSVLSLVTIYLLAHVFINGIALRSTMSYLDNSHVSRDWKNYSYFLSRVGLVKILVSNIDKILVGLIFSPAALAIYYIGIVIPNSATMAIKSALTTVIPKLSKRQSLSFGELGLAILIGLLAAIVSMLLSTNLITPLFGSEYTPAIRYAKIASLALILLPLSQILTNYAFMRAMRNTVFISQVGSPIIKLLLLATLGTLWKLEGFVIVYALIPLIWTLLLLFNLRIDLKRKIVY